MKGKGGINIRKCLSLSLGMLGIFMGISRGMHHFFRVDITSGYAAKAGEGKREAVVAKQSGCIAELVLRLSKQQHCLGLQRLH